MISLKNGTIILLFLTVLGTAFSSGFHLLFRLLYVLLGLIALGYLWAWANVQWLEVKTERRTTRAKVGQKAEESLTVTNKGWLPKLWLEVKDRSGLPGYKSKTVFDMPRGRSRSWKTSTLCTRRGLFTFGPVTITSGDPFGLFQKKRRMGTTHALIVHPATVELPNFTLPTADVPGDGQFQKHTPYPTPNAASLRDYVYGDGLNRIHWPTTARMGRIMVKEFEQDPSNNLWILVDMDRRGQAGTGERSTEEYGVTIAASIAKRYLETNMAVGLMAYGEEHYCIEPDRGSGQMTQIMDSLAVIRSQGRVSLNTMLIGESWRFGRYSTIIIITPSPKDGWEEATEVVARRGARIAIVVLDASTFSAIETSQTTLDNSTNLGIPIYVVKGDKPIDLALSNT